MRTQVHEAIQDKYSSLWKVSFATFAYEPERLVWVSTSSPLFATEDEAYEAGTRALDVLEKTGMFPNMCEVF